MAFEPPSTPSPAPVVMPVSRSRAATRGILCSVPAMLLAAAAFSIYSRLIFLPTGVSNRLVEYCFAVAALPCPIGALAFGIRAIQWFLLAVWPGEVAVVVDGLALTFRLGPFGTRVFDAARIDAKYPFEYSADSADGGFEAFLPEKEQVARFLPRMIHPEAGRPLHRTMLRFIAATETEAATMLGPTIDRWRIAACCGDVGPSPQRRV